jgi:hypothetical protein
VNFSSFIVVPMYVVYIWSNILCVGYRVVVQRSNKSEGAFVYLYCDAQKVNKNSQKGAIDLRSAQGQKTTAFTSRYNDWKSRLRLRVKCCRCRYWYICFNLRQGRLTVSSRNTVPYHTLDLNTHSRHYHVAVVSI